MAIDLSPYFGSTIPILRTIFVVIVSIAIITIIIAFIRKNLLRHAKSKKQISNIKIFSNILRYVGVIFIISIASASFSGTWGDLGLTIGLMSAALGWALQRPITGIAGWIFVVLRRPFEIGDMIVLSGVRGIVSEITLTHISIMEVGGISSSEEKSGRIVFIPNSILFEQNIINYTQNDETTLDEVVYTITFSSDLKKAIQISETEAHRVLREIGLKDTTAYSRTYFQQSGINIHTRFFTPAVRRQEIASRITQAIFGKISSASDISFAFPHTRVILSYAEENKKIKRKYI